MNQVVVMNAPQLSIVNQSAALAEMIPAGISRMAVRGFFASMFRSAHRLKAIALVRAKTIHRSTFILNASVKPSGCW